MEKDGNYLKKNLIIIIIINDYNGLPFLFFFFFFFFYCKYNIYICIIIKIIALDVHSVMGKFILLIYKK